MNQDPKPTDPISFALSITFFTSSITLFATFLTLIDPPLKTITPFLEALYAPVGYWTTIPGALLATLFVAIDTFFITYIFAKIYNKILKILISRAKERQAKNYNYQDPFKN